MSNEPGRDVPVGASNPASKLKKDLNGYWIAILNNYVG
jgi:hypothetical protein